MKTKEHKVWDQQQDEDLLYAWAGHVWTIETLAAQFETTKSEIIRRLIWLGGCDNE